MTTVHHHHTFKLHGAPPAPWTHHALTTRLAINPDDLPGPLMRTATVAWVYDGDTLQLSGAGSAYRVRLVGLDAPEVWHPRRKNEPGAAEARDLLTSLCLGMPCVFCPDPQQPEYDHYNRRVGHLFRRPDGLCIGLELIRQGWARPWPAYCHTFSRQYEAAASFARSMQWGLWRLVAPRRGRDKTPPAKS